MTESSDWISVSEAERLTGLSVRTLKRMAAEGQIKSSRTPGDHVRVLRHDVDRLLRREAPASVSVSTVLANKKERVEELSLELQERRAMREIRKLSEEDAEAQQRRTETRRVHELSEKRAVEETRLEAARDAERREREQREAEAQRQRAEFRRRWLSFATDRFPVWVSYDQRQGLLAAVEETISARDVADVQLMPRLLLSDTVSRVCAPWESERQDQQKREQLIERTIKSELPIGATDAERAKAAAGARSVLAQVPATASDWELHAAVSAAVERIVKAIEQRKASERDKERQRAEAERVKDAERRAQRNVSPRPAPMLCFARYERATSSREGVEHVFSYLSELFRKDEITRDEWLDFAWQRQLQEQVREALESELRGADDESENDARQIAEEIVDEELS